MTVLNKLFSIRADPARIEKYKAAAAHLGQKPHVWARQVLDREAERITRKREKNGDKP